MHSHKLIFFNRVFFFLRVLNIVVKQYCSSHKKKLARLTNPWRALTNDNRTSKPKVIIFFSSSTSSIVSFPAIVVLLSLLAPRYPSFLETKPRSEFWRVWPPGIPAGGPKLRSNDSAPPRARRRALTRQSDQRSTKV